MDSETLRLPVLLDLRADDVAKWGTMKMKQCIPALPVQSIHAAVEFYQSRLGFSIPYQDEGFARAVRDEAEIHLWAASDETWRNRAETLSGHPVCSGAESFLAGTASCRIRVEDINSLFKEYSSQGVIYSPSTVVEKQPWGVREFPALDLHCNLITFYERI